MALETTTSGLTGRDAAIEAIQEELASISMPDSSAGVSKETIPGVKDKPELRAVLINEVGCQTEAALDPPTGYKHAGSTH